jgi:hypothetical protein
MPTGTRRRILRIDDHEAPRLMLGYAITARLY